MFGPGEVPEKRRMPLKRPLLVKTSRDNLVRTSATYSGSRDVPGFTKFSKATTSKRKIDLLLIDTFRKRFNLQRIKVTRE